MQDISYTNKTKKNSPAIFLIPIIIILLLVPFLIKNSEITVIGQAELSFTPDHVSILVTKVNSSQNPKEAIAQGQTDIDNLISIAQSSEQGSEIKKGFYEVQPNILSNGLYLYQVINAFTLKSSNPKQVDKLIEMLYENGATTISDVTFSSDNQDEAIQKARKEAISDAKKQAKQIAQAAGKRLGRIATIVDDLQGASSTVSLATTENTTAQTKGFQDLGSEKNTPAVGFDYATVTKTVSITYKIW